jgi:hypothetical protein
MTSGCRSASRSTRSAAISPLAASWPGALPRYRWAACAGTEAALLPDNVNVQLILARTAERERNRRRQQAQLAS